MYQIDVSNTSKSLADEVRANVNVDSSCFFEKSGYVLVIIGSLIGWYIIYKYVRGRNGKLSWTIHSFHFTLSSAKQCAQND
jgi:hypothetical protein